MCLVQAQRPAPCRAKTPVRRSSALLELLLLQVIPELMLLPRLPPWGQMLSTHLSWDFSRGLCFPLDAPSNQVQPESHLPHPHHHTSKTHEKLPTTGSPPPGLD